MRFHQLVIISFLAIFNIAAAIPSDWRTPTIEESNQNWRNDKPHRYLTVKADFNGDGIIDEAQLLMKKNGNKMALFVFISQGNNFKSFQLDSLSPKDIATMGIDLVEKGKYKTACGKGYFDCKSEEPKEITLNLPSINYFKSESSNSFFYWDNHSKNFKRIWISD